MNKLVIIEVIHGDIFVWRQMVVNNTDKDSIDDGNLMWKMTISKVIGSVFFTSDNGITEIVISKKVLLKPLVKWYLKKRQKVYIQDLEKALANEL
ncbi:hypothetical protein [Proteus alimentorum]|uniref:hypothetical protein n=1 Tax=Proteus alimentorum TaxID=1973495 RepID=UPI000BFFE3C8|nr:hypothetical protein [Proteus alimentorum]